MIEIYVLCEERQKKVLLKFLEIMLPNRRELADEYCYPEYVEEPEIVFDDYMELIAVLERNQLESYSIYWDNIDSSEVKSAMAFFTEDASLMLGLFVALDSAEKYLSKMSDLVGGKFGLVNSDSPPPSTRNEFIECCRRSNLAKVYEGEFVSASIELDRSLSRP